MNRSVTSINSQVHLWAANGSQSGSVLLYSMFFSIMTATSLYFLTRHVEQQLFSAKLIERSVKLEKQALISLGFVKEYFDAGFLTMDCQSLIHRVAFGTNIPTDAKDHLNKDMAFDGASMTKFTCDVDDLDENDRLALTMGGESSARVFAGCSKIVTKMKFSNIDCKNGSIDVDATVSAPGPL